MIKMKFQGHIKKIGPTYYRLTSLSFHVNQSSHTWDTAFSKAKVKVKVQHHIVGPASYWLNSFHFISNGPDSILEIQLFQNSPWKSKIKVMVEVGVWSHTVGPASNKCTSYEFMSNKSTVPMMWPMELLTAINLLQLLESHTSGSTFWCHGSIPNSWNSSLQAMELRYSIWHEYITVVWCKLNCRGLHVADEKCMEISEAITPSLQCTT